MSKRLAITISGAVSLGSYEAGVLYETLEALRQHNTDLKTLDDEKIYIDVLTGASAGGMTTAIAAQKLLYEGNSLSEPLGKPDANPFYRPWVLDVNLDRLLALDSDEDPSHSIFSSDLIENISAAYITKRYQSHVPLSPTDRIKHPAAADHIYVGLAMANLNGVNYSQDLRTGGKFTYTRHQDQLRLDFLADGSDGRDNSDIWELVRSCAVACGAFPFAFRVKDIFRHQSEYPGADPFPTPTEQFTYTDGGTFQNEPLGMAKNFVDTIDTHLNSDSRFYLFVAPGSRDGTQNLSFHAPEANFVGTGQHIAFSIFEQARFHDWIAAEEINGEVEIFNQRANALFLALKSGALNPASLQSAATALLPLLFAGYTASQGASWARLRVQFLDEYNQLGGQNIPPSPAATAFIDSLLTLETAADLGPKDEMNIYGITASDKELASFDLSAFAGFFDQRYRQHDYDVGRKKARDFLTNPATLGGLGPINWQPQGPIQIDNNLNDLKVANMNVEVRKKVFDRFHDRANEVLKELGLRGFLIGDSERGIVMDTVVVPFLKKTLNL
jgi:hypothetical protein